MRILKIILLMLIGFPTAGDACTCLDPTGQYFLNTVGRISWKSGAPYVDIPENAKGILFYSDAYFSDVRYFATGKSIVETVPPGITAAQFSIVEVETGQSIQPMIKRLNVDRQIGWGDHQRVYKMSFVGILPILQDVTAEVKKANGIFRVAPAGGFRAGYRYRFTYRPHGAAHKSLRTEVTEVKIGPPVTLPLTGSYGLRLDGPLTAKMITLPNDGRCGDQAPAIVQELNYAVPRALEPYRNGVLFFTQRARLGKSGTVSAFVNRRYQSALCTSPPPGHGELGPLKDLAVATCERFGHKWENWLVKGYVGMLELEDTLHETATYKILLEDSADAMCATVRKSDGV